MKLDWKNLDETESFSRLMRIDGQIDLTQELSEDRALNWKIDSGAGISLYYGASLLGTPHIDALEELADEQEILGKYRALLNGEIINTGERRRVLHHLTRGQLGKDIVEDGVNLREFYIRQNSRVREFSEGIHSGQIAGSTGKRFDTIIQIGIGGSDLGPRALYLALEGIHRPKMQVHFISNVDPDDAALVCSRVNPESTLFILVSKSGTTSETLANRDSIIDWMKSARIRGFDPAGHFIAITSKDSSLANSNSVLCTFHIDNNIGGRYSATSAVGGAVLSLAFGPDVFDELLAGAHEMDKCCLAKNVRNNAALLDALIGIYYRNVLGFQTSAVLPYSQALRRFPAHLQQLDMESNGKCVNRFGDRISYPTSPVIFGEPGTNGQHSFYQLLHQGTEIMPLQFIGFLKEQSGMNMGTEISSKQRQMNANLAAQIVAFAKGSRNKNLNKNFEGCRPSTLLVARRLNARVLGGLLAYYENKVMFQGFCWNLNSFDQEGVQLGKTLTMALLSGKSDDAALNVYAEILGIA